MFREEPVDPNATAEELYAMAKESMEKNNWGDAVERLRAVEAKYPYGVYAEQSQLDTIYVYYRNSEPGLAIAAADRFIKLHPTHESVDYAYYLKGLSSYEEDKTTFGFLLGKDDLSDRDPSLTLDALNAFKDVYTLFPESRYAPSSRERVGYLTNALAKHEIAIATYYYGRGAHVAVVNRAKGVVEDYAQTPSVEHALVLLTRSYQKMGLEDLANDSKRVLALNFPESPFLSDRTKIEGDWFSNPIEAQDEERGIMASIRDLLSRDKPAE